MKKIKVSEMTVQEMYAAHQELWFWLANHPDKWKRDWPGWEVYGNSVRGDCFACHYNARLRGINCEKCFLESEDLCGRDGLFSEWEYIDSNDLRTREVLADLIATLPLKKKYQ